MRIDVRGRTILSVIKEREREEMVNRPVYEDLGKKPRARERIRRRMMRRSLELDWCALKLRSLDAREEEFVVDWRDDTKTALQKLRAFRDWERLMRLRSEFAGLLLREYHGILKFEEAQRALDRWDEVPPTAFKSASRMRDDEEAIEFAARQRSGAMEKLLACAARKRRRILEYCWGKEMGAALLRYAECLPPRDSRAMEIVAQVKEILGDDAPRVRRASPDEFSESGGSLGAKSFQV